MKRFLIPLLLVSALLLTAPTALAEDNLIATGATGADVVRIQTRLMDLGYYTYKPTGSFHSFTRASVIAYQQASALMADGTIGVDSMRTLFNNTATRAPFQMGVPMNFSIQSRSLRVVGTGTPWETVRDALTVGSDYTLIHCVSGEEITLTYRGGVHHAQMQPADTESTAALTTWLGDEPSGYKCAVTLVLEGDRIAASLQWSGQSCCVYFTGSGSEISGLPDVEHNMLIALATQKDS